MKVGQVATLEEAVLAVPLRNGNGAVSGLPGLHQSLFGGEALPLEAISPSVQDVQAHEDRSEARCRQEEDPTRTENGGSARTMSLGR